MSTGVPLTVALVQAASSPVPAGNREHLRALHVAPADLVLLPEASHREFGKPEVGLGASAEAPGGPFVTAVVEKAAAHGGPWISGLLERGEDAARPYNTL